MNEFRRKATSERTRKQQTRKFKRDALGILMSRCLDPKCRKWKYLIDFRIRYPKKDEPYNRHSRCKDCVNRDARRYAQVTRNKLRAIGLSCRKNPLGMKQMQPWRNRNKIIIERKAA